MKDSCCVRGRQGAIHSPGHWTRDLLRLPPIAAELPEEFEQSFLIGKPWFFGEHEFLTEQCILSQFRLRCFRGSRLVALVFFLSYCDFIFMLSFSLTSLEVCFRALLVQCFQSFLPDIRLPPFQIRQVARIFVFVFENYFIDVIIEAEKKMMCCASRKFLVAAPAWVCLSLRKRTERSLK